jgi:hypothetical protein
MTLDQDCGSFLHMEPDTGLIVVMAWDEDGFRPMTASDEFEALQLQASSPQASAPAFAEVEDTDEALDAFVAMHTRAYMAA